MVEGVSFLIGRLGRRGTGLVRVLYEVPAAVGHKFGPPAVQCGSQAPDLLEEDGLAFCGLNKDASFSRDPGVIEPIAVRRKDITNKQLHKSPREIALAIPEDPKGLPGAVKPLLFANRGPGGVAFWTPRHLGQYSIS